jgi:hypothetical protein
MRAGFAEIAGKRLSRREEIHPLIARLIRAEQPGLIRQESQAL